MVSWNIIPLSYFTTRKPINFILYWRSRLITSVAALNDIRQQLPTSSVVQQELIRKKPTSSQNTKLLKVAVIGNPNAGKSTLVNQLTGWHVCSVSKKVHTTRKQAKAVLIKGNSQIVFLDTPGLVNPTEIKKYKLETSFMNDPEKALNQADLFLVLHDASKRWSCNHLSPEILRLLYLYPEKQSILVLNKIDLVKEKRLLLQLMRTLTEGFIENQHELKRTGEPCRPVVDDSTTRPNNFTETQVMDAIQGKVGWPRFSRVFLISGLNGDGVSDIQEYLETCAQPHSWMYHSSVVTDQDPREIAISILKAKLLDTFPEEIPYLIDVSIEHWDVNQTGMLNVLMKLDCHKIRIARIVVGKGGRFVAQIARQVEQELRNIFRCDICLKLDVRPFIRSPG